MFLSIKESLGFFFFGFGSFVCLFFNHQSSKDTQTRCKAIGCKVVRIYHRKLWANGTLEILPIQHSEV